jgi:rubrerythrin
MALKLHLQIAAMTADPSLREKFNKLSKEEELHIQTVEKILTHIG